jgi:hypothetical protein
MDIQKAAVGGDYILNFWRVSEEIRNIHGFASTCWRWTDEADPEQRKQTANRHSPAAKETQVGSGKRMSGREAASSVRTEISALEASIIAKLATATYPPATASKRFVRDLSSGYIQQLSDKGRTFLAFVAHRFRRQYELTQEEWQWVREHQKEETK